MDTENVGSNPTGRTLERTLVSNLKDYQRKWIARRRSKWIEENGPCVKCGSYNNLEVDHVNPEEKEYNISQIWSRKEEIRDKELAKCQVLCHDCHKEKSKKDLSLSLSGTSNPAAKLTLEQIESIRNSTDKVANLAKEYNVHKRTIYKIRSGERWKQ